MTIAARHQACRYTSTARSATEHGFRVTLLLSHQFRAGFWAVWRDSTRRLEYERFESRCARLSQVYKCALLSDPVESHRGVRVVVLDDHLDDDQPGGQALTSR